MSARKLVLRVAVSAAILYAGLCVIIYYHQAGFIFVPQREVQFSPQDFGCSYEEVRFGQDRAIDGWWLASDTPSGASPGAFTLIYFHGNGGSIGANAEHACRLRKMGFNVLLFDYRGYGRSADIKPSENTFYQDADAAWDYVVHIRKVEPRNVVLYGHSLGAAVAIEMATRHPDGAALIEESGFTSIATMARRSPFFRYFPVSLILNQHFASREKIGGIRMPVLIIHGTSDPVVPAEMGEELFNHAPRPKMLFLVPGAGHENCAVTAGPAYAERIRTFMSTTALTEK